MTREALDTLPGVGAYTAGAVVCFSRGESVAFADTNIRRVLGRIVLGRVASAREAVALDEELVPRSGADRWHHALMDLGATVCVSRAPRCDGCPVAAVCRSRGRTAPLPPRRQATFASSDRRVRGRIVRLLVERRSLSQNDVRRALKDAPVPRLLERLLDEGLVERVGRSVRLPTALS